MLLARLLRIPGIVPRHVIRGSKLQLTSFLGGVIRAIVSRLVRAK